MEQADNSQQSKKENISKRLKPLRGMAAIVLGAIVLVGGYYYFDQNSRDQAFVLSKGRLFYQAGQIQEPQDAKVIGQNPKEAIFFDNALSNFTVEYSNRGMEELRKNISNLEVDIKLVQVDITQNQTQEWLEDKNSMRLWDVGGQRWDENKGKGDVLVDPIRILSAYVLPKYPEAQWISREAEITAEWNAKIQQLIWHEADHLKEYKEGLMFPSEPDAHLAQKESLNHKFMIWIKLKPGKHFADNPQIMAEYGLFLNWIKLHPESKQIFQ